MSGLANFIQRRPYEGTELVKGPRGSESTLTQRYIFVSSVGQGLDGAQLLAYVQERFVEAKGYYDQSQPYLPLVQLRVKQIARTLIEVVAVYRGVEVGDDVQGGTTVAEFESVAAPRKVWAHANTDDDGEGGEFRRGLPFGALLNGDDIDAALSLEEIQACPSDVVVHRVIRVKVQRQTFGVNPLSIIDFAPNTTGGGMVAGMFFEPGTLLFEGITSQASTIGTSDPTGQTPVEALLYTYSVSFLFDPFGFPAQAFRNDGTLAVVNQYQFGDWKANI
jgi:hypothetical protein